MYVAILLGYESQPAKRDLYNKIFLLSEPKAGRNGEFWVISVGVAIIHTVSANLWASERETRILTCGDWRDSGIFRLSFVTRCT